MKLSKMSFAVLLAAGLTAVSPMSQAQNTNAAPGARQGGSRGIEMQLTRLTQQLSLTEDQKPKIKTVLEEQIKKIGELRNDSALEPQERRAKMVTIREGTTKKMKEILTPEQFKKYEEFQLQRNRRGGPGRADAPAGQERGGNAPKDGNTPKP